MVVKKLTELTKNQKGLVCSVDGDVFLKRRLLELGFVNGTEVKILHISPLKNTFLVSLRDYTLAIKHQTLQLVSVVAND